MKYEIILIIFGLLLSGAEERNGKWLFHPRTITKYAHEKSMVTESVPSSCVVVQASLPPCRHVRQLDMKLDIKPHPTERIKITASPELLGVPGFAYGPRYLFGSEKHPRERQEDEKPLSWVEYFGLEDVTVTKTAIHSVTAKYYDPNTVVTFNVRGCHPSKLPFNLPLCNNETRRNSSSKEVHYAP